MAKISYTGITAVILAILISIGGGVGIALSQSPTEGILVYKNAEYVIEPFDQALEEALYQELRTEETTGTLLNIKRINPTTERLVIGGISPADAVKAGLPDTRNHMGQCLKVASGGTSFDWEDCPAGGGGGAALSDTTPEDVGTAAPGKGTEASRDDHVHGEAAQTGTNTTAIATNATNIANNGAAITSNTAVSTGNINRFGSLAGSSRPNAGLCAKVNPGKNGLTYADCGSPRHLSDAPAKPVAAAASAGTRTEVSRDDHVHSGAALSDKAPQSVSTSARAGIGTAASRDDHSHIGPIVRTTAPESVGTANAAGTSPDAARIDHVHAGPVPALADNQDKVLAVKSDGSAAEWRDGHAVVQAGLPTITGQGGRVLTVNSGATGLEWSSAGGGTGGGGFSRTKHFSCTFPTASSNNKYCDDFTTPGAAAAAKVILDNLKSGSPFPFIVLKYGSSGTYTESGSVGMVACSVPVPEKMTGSQFDGGCSMPGSSHVDVLRVTIASTGFSVRAILDGNERTDSSTTGEVWTYDITGAAGAAATRTPTIPKPTAAGALKHLRVNTGGSAYELADPPQASNQAPAQVKTGSAVAGSRTDFSRADHAHNFALYSVANPAPLGTPSPGAATTAARADHVHGAGALAGLPAIPADHADHEYLITANSAGNGVEWTHGIDDALQINASQIGQADERITQLESPLAGNSTGHANGWARTLTSCTAVQDEAKTKCSAVWRRPAMLERVEIFNKSVSWSSHSGSFTFTEEDFALHHAMQSVDTGFRRFELYARYQVGSIMRFSRYDISGQDGKWTIPAQSSAYYYSQNSNNTLTGTIGFAHIEINPDTNVSPHKVVVGLNSLGQSTVVFTLYGVR